MKKINVGIIGCGTIGSGVAKYLSSKKSLIAARRGVTIEIARIADKDLRRAKSERVPQKLLTRDVNSVLGNPNIDIIVELMGGIHPAKEYILKSIMIGKHVVTANKALLASCGMDIFKAAKRNGVNVKFEASVGGGIPVIRALTDDFLANNIQAVYGIVNGTSNFILSKMEEDSITFSNALKEAQSQGIVEKNFALDVSGMDSAHKISILSLLSFGKNVPISKIFIEGIEDIELCDIQYARELGYSIKLLAIAKRDSEELDIRVHPTLLTSRHLLAGVRGAQNAIYIKGDMIGESLLYGEGAGQRATSSAVISDIIEIAKSIASGSDNRVLNMNFESGIKGIKEIGRVKSRYYIRFMAQDKPGVLARIAGILAKSNISISSVTQKERHKQHAVPIVMMTHEVVESGLRMALKDINRLSSICGKPVAIRMEMK